MLFGIKNNITALFVKLLDFKSSKNSIILEQLVANFLKRREILVKRRILIKPY